MTATHNALLGALSRYSHFDEFSEPLEVRGNILTPAQRRALAMLNLTDGFLAQTPSGVVTPGGGISAGVGTVFSSERIVQGEFVRTRIYIDLTGLASSTTDLDIIGVGALAAYLAQVTAGFGVPFAGRMACLETPAGGADDIDLYAATENTGVFDGGIAALAETAVVTSDAAWVVGQVKAFTSGALLADKYLYLTGGEAGTAATYTAGRFMIEIDGSTFAV